MKTICLALLLSLLTAGAAAQNVIIGGRAPELRVATWLEGQQPRPAKMTYYEFYQSANPTCNNSVERLKSLSQQLGDRLHVVVLTGESVDRIGPLLSGYVSEAMSVGVDPSGKIFQAFGITYVPSGVLVDAKNRVLWLGNSHQLNEQLIDKIIR